VDDTWLLPGSLRPDEIAEFTGVHLPESGAYETVAGLLISRLGRMPENFDSVEVVATMDASSFLGVPEGQVGRPDDQPIPPNVEDDLPRAVTVRLTVHRRERRRIDSVVLSAVSADIASADDDEGNDEADQ
jgi:CBS domain containing-hemolysin-like protein